MDRYAFLAIVASLFVGVAISTAQESAPSRDRAAIDGYESTVTTPAPGVPIDWSNRHVIFSQPNPGTPLFDQVRHDPRYWLQRIRRGPMRDAAASRNDPSGAVGARLALRGFERNDNRRRRDSGRAKSRMKGAWIAALATNLTPVSPTFPAVFVANPSSETPDCVHDFVVYTLNNTGHDAQGDAGGRFNLIGFNQIYAACKGPSVYFAYNASTSGNSSQSGLNGAPVLSLDGSEVAFIENDNAGGTAIFHVLKWAPAPSSLPDFPAPTAALPNCTKNGGVAPCEYSLTYSSLNSATLSSPYVDYATDTAYVTDDGGDLYAITPVFGGQPRIKPGWGTAEEPAVSTGSSFLTPPVYDSVSQNVFAADGGGDLWYFRTNATSSGTCLAGTQAPCVGRPADGQSAYPVSNTNVIEAPVIDSSTQKVLVFSNGDPAGDGFSSVVQTDTTLSAAPVVAHISNEGGTRDPVHGGTFDNTYFNSTDGSGSLYACGQQRNDSHFPAYLYAFALTKGVLSTTPVATPLSLASVTNLPATQACSLLTENAVTNATTGTIIDRLFLGLSNNCVSGERDGCIVSFDITHGFPSAVSAHRAAAGGTSGIAIDNTADASSSITTDVYFMTPLAQRCPNYNGQEQTTYECAVSLYQQNLE
ncbi:MAG: hypothetical protein ACREQE_03825 [Candidatus Binataceae bacterium]